MRDGPGRVALKVFPTRKQGEVLLINTRRSLSASLPFSFESDNNTYKGNFRKECRRQQSVEAESKPSKPDSWGPTLHALPVPWWVEPGQSNGRVHLGGRKPVGSSLKDLNSLSLSPLPPSPSPSPCVREGASRVLSGVFGSMFITQCLMFL